MVDGKCVIPRGYLVKGKVTEARKSSLAGTKGKLAINISSMNLPSGDPVFFTNTDVRIFQSELIAEVCLDRIVHKAMKFALSGECLRNKY